MRVLFVFILISFSVFAFGQEKKEKKSIEEKSSEATQELSKDLKLTKDQEAKIKDFYFEYFKEKEIISEKIKKLENDKKKIKTTRNLKIENVLTEEQKKELAVQKKKKKRKK